MFINKFNEILGVSDSRDAPEKLMKILYNKNKREEMFNELLEIKKYLDHDWFHEYFQEEHAQRKKHKQDFTPQQVCEITNRIAQPKEEGTYFEATAGSGGMAIEHWNNNKSGFYHLEELSDRAIPFLLFNLLIRGINAVVIHGDSLNRTAKGVFFTQNNGKYSNLNLMPYNDITEDEFNVEFTDFRHKEIKEDLIKEEIDWLGLFEMFSFKTKPPLDVTDKYMNKTVEEAYRNYEHGLIFDMSTQEILGGYPDDIEELKGMLITKATEIDGLKVGLRVEVDKEEKQ